MLFYFHQQARFRSAFELNLSTIWAALRYGRLRADTRSYRSPFGPCKVSAVNLETILRKPNLCWNNMSNRKENQIVNNNKCSNVAKRETLSPTAPHYARFWYQRATTRTRWARNAVLSPMFCWNQVHRTTPWKHVEKQVENYTMRLSEWWMRLTATKFVTFLHTADC